MNKLLKILLIIACIIVGIVIIAFIFIKIYKPFGSSPSKEDKKDYAKRSSIFKDGKFKNTGNFDVMGEWNDPYKDRSTKKGTTPKEDLPYKKYKYTKANKEDVLVTWFGHSSVLIQMHGKNILIDPIFDNFSSPVSFIGPKRFSKIPVNIEDLPKIDVVLYTHDHYDHLSYHTVKQIDSKVKRYITPVEIDKDLEKFGVSSKKIQNMAWWEEEIIDGLTIACTPSRHFSGRYIFDSNDTLWSSWTLIDDNNKVFISGDTGYGDQFKEIYEKYGEFDFALFDGAQYNERWHAVHMFPEEVVNAAIDIKTKVSMVEHYGAFVLSDHSWDDPVDRFTRQAKEKNIEYVTPIIGETFNIKDYKNYQNEWWKDIE